MSLTPPFLHVTTLGRFEIARHQEILSGGNWNRRKVCDLFKLLISAEQHRLHREQIQEILWPESSSEQAANSFGKTLYLLRRALEPDLSGSRSNPSSYIFLDHDALMLAPDTMQIDADLFEAAARQLQSKGRSLGPELPVHERRALLDEFDRVLQLYGGDYLPEDLYEDWSQRRRDRLRRVHSWLLEQAAEQAIAGAMGLRACDYLQTLLEDNATDEQTHRQLMLIYARLGRRGEALNQYQVLRDALREDLRANPLPETVELYRAIQAGRVPADLAQTVKQWPGPPAQVPVIESAESSRPPVHVHVHAANDQHNAAPLSVDAANRTSTLTEEDEKREPFAAGRGDPERVRAGSVMVGRDLEMQRIEQSCRQVRQGQNRVMVISGEPGIGKTRLAREFARLQEQQPNPPTVLWGYCYELSGSLPYQPIIDAIDKHARGCSTEQLNAMLGNSIGDLAKIVPEIRARIPDLPLASVMLGPEVERRNLYNAVNRYFDAIAAERPTTIILDDLQWADSATIQLLGYLTSQPVNSPVSTPQSSRPFYLLLYRADEVHDAHPLRGLIAALSRPGIMQETRLKRLTQEEVRQLLVSLAGHDVTEAFTGEIYKHTEGNPFFISEALLSLVQDGKIQKIEGRWQTTVSLDELLLPQSVRLLIEQRLSHFSPECRVTLALASVLGRQFSSSLLCQVRNLSEDTIAEHMDDAIRLQVLTPFSEKSLSESAQGGRRIPWQDLDLAFTHDKIREVLYQGLNPLRRRSMHRQVAQAIEAHYVARLQPHYGRLASHYQAAEDYPRAVDYFLKAAAHAGSVYAFVDAADYTEHALELLIADEDRPLRAELLRQLTADVYLYIARPDKAIEAGMASCALWRDLGNLVKEAEARLDVAFALHWMGRESESLVNIQRALECLAKLPAELRLLAKAHVQWGLAAVNMGDTVLAFEQLELADELHAGIGSHDPFIGVVSAWSRSWLSFLAETPQRMLDTALDGSRICREALQFGWEPMLTYSAAWAQMLMGHMAEGERTARETLEQAQRHNAVGATGWAYLVLAFLAIQQGRWDEANQFADQANELAVMLHDEDLRARVLWSRSVGAGWRGEWESAIRLVVEALPIAKQDGEVSMAYPYLLMQAAKAHFHAGKLRLAQHYLTQSMDCALAQGYSQLPAIGRRIQGRILQAQGRVAEAEPYFATSLADLADLGDEVEYARTQEAYGEYLLARRQPGDDDAGRELLASARATYQRLNIKG